MLVIGIDENGLGPLLGPLLVTGTAFRADSYDPQKFWALSAPDLPADDSKVLFRKSHPAPGEKAFLAWLAVFGVHTTDWAQLIRSVVAPSPLAIPCEHPLSPCLPGETSLPLWCERTPDPPSLAVWNRFDTMRITALGTAAHQVCAGAFNQALDRPGANKLKLDFELMMSLAEILSRDAEDGEEVLVLCGKIGSTRNYRPWFEAADLSVETVIMETPAISEYVIAERGTIRFIRDGDSSHLPVAVASMIGKYLRELAMIQLNRTLGWDQQKQASGYRDKVTATFVEDTRLRRVELGFPDSCFKRNF